jgi:DeoR/GlpR family transcriptional regulator of sugar metabolism
LQKARRSQILALLREQGMVKIPELAKTFGVSVITIRRDLDELVHSGLVEKVYGGAILAPQKMQEPEAQRLFHARLAQNHREKRLIGMAAAKLVKDGETIILDIGTTPLEVAKHLEDHENLTVLTNSLPILNQLADARLNVYSLGGKLRGNELALHGSLAYKALNDFCVDKAFIGAGGITLKNGITDHNLDSAELCAAIASRSRQTILVADSSKFGKDASVIIGPLTCVETIITDSGIPEGYAEGIRKAGIELIIVDI